MEETNIERPTVHVILVLLFSILFLPVENSMAQLKLRSGSEQVFGPIVIREESLPVPEYATVGYREIRLTVRNTSSQEHVVEVAFPSYVSWERRLIKRTLVGRITIEPETTEPLYLFHPAFLSIHGHKADVFIDGHLAGQVRFPAGEPRRWKSSFSTTPAPVLDLYLDREETTAPVPSRTRPVRIEIVHLEGWKEISCWQTLSPWMAVVMPWPMLESLDPLTRNSIRRWVRLGGILGVWGASHARVLAAFFDQDCGTGNPLLTGAGTVVTWREWEQTGRPTWPPELTEAVIRTWQVEEDLHRRIPDYAKNPARKPRSPPMAFLLIPLCVGVLLGPVNLWWSGRRSRKLRALWTTPLLALGLSVLLLSAARARDTGAPLVWNGAVTVMQPGGESATIGSLAVEILGPYRAPMSFDPLSQLVFMNLGNGRMGPGMQLERGDRQVLRGALKKGMRRVLAYRRPHKNMKEVRVVMSASDQPPVVINELDVPLLKVWAVDRQGAMFQSSASVAPGSQCSLVPAERFLVFKRQQQGVDGFAVGEPQSRHDEDTAMPASFVTGSKGRFLEQCWREKRNHALELLESMSRFGVWAADVEGSPFAEYGVPRSKKIDVSGVITGVVTGESK